MMHCYICDVLLTPREIRLDPRDSSKFLPCGSCRTVVAEDLAIDEEVVIKKPLDISKNP